MRRQVSAQMPTKWGLFNMIAFSDDEKELMPHIAFVHKDMSPDQEVLVRIHSECLTGDLFGSKRCDCGEQLEKALQITAENGGVVLYLRQEGRGIGIINKLKAYNLQDKGFNTVDANTHMGLEADARQYDIAIKMLQDLGVEKIKLLTNNPLKLNAFSHSPIQIIERVPLIIKAHETNKDYLQTKKNVMGHLFD